MNRLSLSCDLLVIGSGAGGLSTAVVASALGLKVILAEKEPVFGGTTAWSGGWMWIPMNPLAVEAGIVEDIAAPTAYLRHELGDGCDEALTCAYLQQGTHMVDFLRTHSRLSFLDGNTMPDFHGRTPHALGGGRSVCAAPFDGRQLGVLIRKLRPPLHETTLWGMPIAGGAELRHFMNAFRSWPSFVFTAKRLLGHAGDLLRHGRGMRLVNGGALVGALLQSAADKGVHLRAGSAARRLLVVDGRVCGAALETPEGELEVLASHGVVLACGGFPHDPVRRSQLMPHDPQGRTHWSAAPPGNTGDGLRLGESAGAVVDTRLVQAAALAPVSRVPRRDGSHAHFPHLLERGKPGLIAVTRAGRRFVNEADSYHDFMQALLRSTPDGESHQAWLIGDHAFVRRYGLGAVKPAPLPLAPWLRNGYLLRGKSLRALADACGIDGPALEATVKRYNAQATTGRDDDFAKGETPYNRAAGDASPGNPNPCMAPLLRPPFYAVKVLAGSLGTFAGLKTDVHARALDTRGTPVAGLYAVGNDMNSIMGGHYPSGGITLGPAMTFGFIAAHHAAGRPLPGA